MSSENKICKTTITSDGVRLDFADGDSLICSTTRLPEETIAQAALFGIRRKVTNSFADVKGDIAKAKAEAKATIEQLEAGLWTAPREIGPSTKAASDLVEAVMAITGKDRQVVESKLESMTKEDRAALRKNDRVSAELADLKAKRARAKVSDQPSVSVDSMFD